MLARVADVYDREVQVAIKRFLAVLEPALILTLAVLIGGIVFSILMGVMGMSELVRLIARLKHWPRRGDRCPMSGTGDNEGNAI